jgi:hypothetical protein
MASKGAVRFAQYLKGVVTILDGYNWTSIVSGKEEAEDYKKLEGLISDAPLLMGKDNPKTALVIDRIMGSLSYWRVKRTDPENKPYYLVSHRVARQLKNLYPILEVDPMVLIKTVEVPVDKPAVQNILAKAPAETIPGADEPATETVEQAKPAPKDPKENPTLEDPWYAKVPGWGWGAGALGLGVLIFGGVLATKKKR